MIRKTWFIPRLQIEAGAVDGAIIQVDPEQIPDIEILNLRGGVRLRIEGAKGLADVVTDRATRKFFRALHDQWPWAGYFLRISPIEARSSAEEIVDLSVFMSLLWVHVDELTYIETANGVGLHYDATQFHEHLFELQSRAAQLGATMGLPPAVIHARAAVISRAVASYFEAGEALKP